MSDEKPLLPGAMPVALKDVERELSRQLNLRQADDKKEVMQLVRMSNLVIYCNTREVAERVAAQVPDVLAVHPARVLLLVGDNGTSDNKIQASVCVEGHKLGGHQQACSEQVVLSAPAGLADRLPFAVRSLLIGDLPTNLWWASPEPPPLAGNLLYDLGETAQKILYDSLGWRDPARGVAATATWL
jgi:glucose-6-phosphate dehydrogenase assembly protein OpcA